MENQKILDFQAKEGQTPASSEQINLVLEIGGNKADDQMIEEPAAEENVASAIATDENDNEATGDNLEVTNQKPVSRGGPVGGDAKEDEEAKVEDSSPVNNEMS